MKQIVIAVAMVSTLAVAGCTTGEKIATGAGVGAAIGGAATHTLVGAAIGAGIGAVATAVIVKNYHNGWCTYRAADGHLYRARCNY